MIFQNEIWSIALVGMSLVALGFIYMIIQAGRPPGAAGAQRKPSTSTVLRRWLFAALLIIFAGATWGTLGRFPEPSQHSPLQASQTVTVVGHQWSWEMSTDQVNAGAPVEFDVTSADVNHGFAIYAPDGRIVIQTQAMPGYTNKILYTFDQPGTYLIRCLEYCGLAHHVMEAQLNVVATATGGQAS